MCYNTRNVSEGFKKMINRCCWIPLVVSATLAALPRPVSAIGLPARMDYIGPQTIEVNPADYAGVYFVSKTTGSDTTGNGTQMKPWENVEFALSQLNDAGPDNKYALIVAQGTYLGKPQRHSDADPVDDPTRFHMRPYIDMYGGFEPAGWTRDIYANQTILTGQSTHRVVYGASYAILDGFIVQGGKTAYPGAGILCKTDSPIIRNCFITGNTVYSDDEARICGGGVYCLESDTQILNCAIYSNTCYNPDVRRQPRGEGAGIWVEYGSLTIMNNNVYDNTAARSGGIYIMNGRAKIVNNRVCGNSALGESALRAASPQPMLISNNVFCWNINPENHYSNQNSTVRVNDEVTFTNCVVYGNGNGGDGQLYGNDTAVFSYCLIQGMVLGTLSFNSTILRDLDPRFLDRVTCRLAPDSPLIDKGTPDAMNNDACLPPGLRTQRNDIGAYGGPFNCGMRSRLLTTVVGIDKGLVFDPRKEEAINVPVTISEIQSVDDVSILIGYNNSVLSAGTPVTETPFFTVGSWDLSPGLISGTIKNSDPSEVSRSGVMFTIPFTLASTAKQGDRSNLEILNVDISDPEGTSFVVDTSDGDVYIAYEIVVYGDVNASGEADVMDVLMVLRDIAEIQPLNEDQFNRANIADPADDEINVLDAMEVFKAAAGTK